MEMKFTNVMVVSWYTRYISERQENMNRQNEESFAGENIRKHMYSSSIERTIKKRIK